MLAGAHRPEDSGWWRSPAATWLRRSGGWSRPGRRARQDHDRYAWIHALVQDALCRVTVAGGLPRAGSDATELARIAAAARLPDFGVRAELHRAALGIPEARDRARALAATLDNPALAADANRRATRLSRSRVFEPAHRRG